MRTPSLDVVSHEGLDDEQRAAVTAPRGPVCVLAGAGTGKTRTITRRIAHLVHTGHVAPGQVLAVTFTARAAGELRTRLRALGVAGVQARTFHAAALRQLRYFWPRAVGGAPWPLLEGKLRRGRTGRRPAARRDRLRVAARLRRRDRVGEGRADHAAGLPGRGGPAAPLDPGPGRAGGRRVRRVRGAQEPGRAPRLRRPAAAHRGRAGGAARHRRGVPGPLPLLRRGRVPGRHGPAAAGAGRLARRPRRPHRGRRREPDHLHLRRRHPALPAGLPAPVPGGGAGAAAPRLPVDAAGGRRGQPADRHRPQPTGRHPAAAGRAAAAGPGAGVHRVRRRARRGGRGGPPDRAAGRRRHRRPPRSPCCSGSTPSPRPTSRR